MVHNYILQVMLAALCLVMAWLGAELKGLAGKWLDTEEKQKAAYTSVLYVQQLYRDFDGEAKMALALDTARKLLNEKGIAFSAEEMKILMEAALAEFKDAFSLDNVVMEPVEEPAEMEY